MAMSQPVQVAGLPPVNPTTGGTQQRYLLEVPGAVDKRSPMIEFWAIIVGLIIVVLLVWFVLILMWPTPRQEVKVVVVNRSDVVNTTVGASSDGNVSVSNGQELTSQLGCLAASTRTWNGTCSCYQPFYGPQCTLESYDDNYNAIGNPDLNNLVINIDDPTTVDRLSFPLESGVPIAPSPIIGSPSSADVDILCTDICNRDDTCRGVVWTPAGGNNFGIGSTPENKPTCQLIRGDVTVKPGATIPYSSTVQSTLYLKEDESPHFKDRVFVYVGNRPIRPWLQTAYSDSFGDNQGRTMFSRQLIKFNWTPTNVINNTGVPLSDVDNYAGEDVNDYLDPWYGIFSNVSFDTSDDNLVSQLRALSTTVTGPITYNSQQYVVVHPNDTIISIPSSWRELWGAFIPVQVDTNNGDLQRRAATVQSSSGTCPLYDSSIQVYQTSRDNSNLNLSTDIETLYRRQSYDRNCETRLPALTHNVRWNKVDFPANGSGRVIDIAVGDSINFISSDGCYHDLVSTNSNWTATSTPYNVGTANPFNLKLQFNSPGTYYVKDRVNPLRVRLIINVIS